MIKQPQPIRVLCVFSTLDRGGAETMCMNLYRHVDRNIVQFDFVKHTQDKGAFEDEIISLGGRVYEAPRFRIYNWVHYRKWWLRHLKGHPEHQIIHGYFFSISAVYFAFAKHMGRKTVGHIHASAADSIIKEYLEKRISSVTDCPLACSEQAGRWIYGNRPFKVLNNALDIELYRYSPETRKIIRNDLGIKSEIVLGTVANLSTVKNPMGLIDIFKDLKKDNPDMILVWVGEGYQRQAIEKRIAEERIENSVMMLGRRNDVPSILQAMDAFLLPSIHEGLPLSVIEAQTAGLRCYVSSAVTREADITGLCTFIDPFDVHTWKETITKDLDKLGHTDTKSEIVEAGYDINLTSKDLTELYYSLLSDEKGFVE